MFFVHFYLARKTGKSFPFTSYEINHTAVHAMRFEEFCRRHLLCAVLKTAPEMQLAIERNGDHGKNASAICVRCPFLAGGPKNGPETHLKHSKIAVKMHILLQSSVKEPWPVLFLLVTIVTETENYGISKLLQNRS